MTGVLLQADEVIITAVLDLANLRNAKNIVDLLEDLAQERRQAASRSQHDGRAQAEITLKEFEQALEIKAISVIEHDSESFSQAANNGQMIEEMNPKAKAAEKFRRDRSDHDAPQGRQGQKKQQLLGIGPRAVAREVEVQTPNLDTKGSRTAARDVWTAL